MNIKCIVCGIETEKKAYHQKFCSRKCKSKHQGTRHKYKIKCGYCGKEFNPHRKKQNFCTRNCAVRGRKGDKQRSAAGNNAQCTYCGKPLYRQPNRLKGSKEYYCDTVCFFEHKKITQIGDNNSNYKAIPLKICKGCGEEYKSYNKNRRYCSPYCSMKYSRSEALANLKKGLEAEKTCCRVLQSLGYHVSRSAGSKGEYDVIAISDKLIILIQVKCTKSEQPSRIYPKVAVEKLKKAICPDSRYIRKQLWTLVKNKDWYIKELPHGYVTSTKNDENVARAGTDL